MRQFSLHEHDGMSLLKEANINVPSYGVGKTPEEVMQLAKQIGISFHLFFCSFIYNFFLFFGFFNFLYVF